MSSYFTIICRRCGRPLRTLESVKRGIGPVCLNKEIGKRNKINYYKKITYPKILKEEDMKNDRTN